MAAIDKLRVSWYSEFDEFRLWCLVNKPSLLYNFYDVMLDRKGWEDWKESIYQSELESCTSFLEKNPTPEQYVQLAADNNTNNKLFIPNLYEKCWEEQKIKYDYMTTDKVSWKEEHVIPICNFTKSQDRYLLWHCPIDFVREYLEKQCNRKTRWYHKLFFKH